jgi:hypothetical protein
LFVVKTHVEKFRAFLDTGTAPEPASTDPASIPADEAATMAEDEPNAGRIEDYTRDFMIETLVKEIEGVRFEPSGHERAPRQAAGGTQHHHAEARVERNQVSLPRTFSACSVSPEISLSPPSARANTTAAATRSAAAVRVAPDRRTYRHAGRSSAGARRRIAMLAAIGPRHLRPPARPQVPRAGGAAGRGAPRAHRGDTIRATEGADLPPAGGDAT